MGVNIFCVQIKDLNPDISETVTVAPNKGLPALGAFPVDEIRIDFIADGNVTVSGIFVRACNTPGLLFLLIISYIKLHVTITQCISLILNITMY